ncbi:hypothetical protein [Micromonospora sp. NPDC049240]|uniref:hypothetical protein n=1 Tax=Micromonospora sp. NPDC049240 TaxID=3155151 RepID=UPI0034058B8A
MSTVEDPTQVVMSRLREVPDAYRRFAAGAPEARRVFGIGADLLAQLIDLGLPHQRRGGELRLDAFDLENISTGLRLRSPQAMTMRQWKHALASRRRPGGADCLVTVEWRCPAPGHRDGCDFALSDLFTPVSRIDEKHEPARGSVVLQAEPSDHAIRFGAEFHPVLAAAARLTFYKLPPQLSNDLSFVRRTGLANCRLACQHLLDTAAAAGVNARPAAGLFLGALFPFRHIWIEVEVGGRWVAADPFFLETLRRWGVVDRPDWPADQSPRGILWRLLNASSIDEPFVTHRGCEASVSVSARWVPQAG